jgi:hypothetical protein
MGASDRRAKALTLGVTCFTLEPRPEAGRGDPAYARARGRGVPAGPSLGHPAGGTQRGLVPKRHYDLALPLLGRVCQVVRPMFGHEGCVQEPRQRKEH